MNLINFDDCIYQGKINNDFFHFIIQQNSLSRSEKLKLRTLFLFAEHFKFSRKKYWYLLNQIYCFKEAVPAFYEKHKKNINMNVCSAIPEDTTVLSKSPLCLTQPFLPKQIREHIGYRVDMETLTVTESELNEKKLKRKLLCHDVHINQYFSDKISIYTLFAKNSWICNDAEIKQIDRSYWKKFILQLFFRFFF